jgi:hypothetical protein
MTLAGERSDRRDRPTTRGALPPAALRWAGPPLARGKAEVAHLVAAGMGSGSASELDQEKLRSRGQRI